MLEGHERDCKEGPREEICRLLHNFERPKTSIRIRSTRNNAKVTQLRLHIYPYARLDNG